MLVSQQSCFSPTQREAEQLKGGDVRSKDGGQVLERGVKDKLKIGVTLQNQVIETRSKNTGAWETRFGAYICSTAAPGALQVS